MARAHVAGQYMRAGPGLIYWSPVRTPPGPLKYARELSTAPGYIMRHVSGAPELRGAGIYRGCRSTVYLAMIVFNHEHI